MHGIGTFGNSLPGALADVEGAARRGDGTTKAEAFTLAEPRQSIKTPLRARRAPGPSRSDSPVGYPFGMTNEAPIDDVSIGGEMIRLGQFLKFAGLLDSGGMVKEAIADGDVTVNGEVDRRRGRQLQAGDVVGFEGRRARVCP